MLDRKDLKHIDIPTWGKLTQQEIQQLVETIRTRVEISKINQTNPMTIHQVLRSEKRTGRLIFDYYKGGISNITFESIEHLPIDKP